MEAMENVVSSPVLPITLNTKGQTPREDTATHVPDVLCSTFSSGGLRKLLYPHYDLDRSTRCTIFRRGLNDVYLLSSREQRYALKVYQYRWRTPAAILSELEAIQHLAAKGVEVAQPIARQDGAWITEVIAPEGRRSAVLFHWLGSETPKWTEPSNSAQLGNLLARLHASSDDIPSNGTRPQMTIEHLTEESLSRIQQTLLDAPDLAKRCDAIVERTRTRLHRADAQPQDWGFCHGDLCLNNARYDAGRLVLIDFDWCSFGWRLFDLATFRWTSRLVDAEGIAWKPFIEAYLQARPSAAGDLRFLRQFMILRHLWHITQCIRTAALIGEGMLADGRLERLIGQCEQLEQDPTLDELR